MAPADHRGEAPAQTSAGSMRGRSVEEVTEVVTRILADILPPGTAIAPRVPIGTYGLSSIMSARLVLEVQSAFRVELTLAALAEPGADIARLVALVMEGRGVEGGSSPVTTERPPPDPAERFAPFGLTPLQQAYLMGKQADLTSDVVGCHLYREFEVAELDAGALEAAWVRLVRHHDMLRAVVTSDGRQRILDEAPPWEMPVHSLRTASPEAFAARVMDTRRRMSHRCYRPGEWPMFGVEVALSPSGPDVIHFSLDAMITDGHGLLLLLDQWWRCYTSPEASLPAGETSVRGYVVALDARTASPGHRDLIDATASRLTGLPPGPQLRSWPPEADEAASAPERDDAAAVTATAATGAGCRSRRPLTGSLDRKEWAGLRARARRLDVSPTSVVLTLFGEALARRADGTPFSLVVTTTDRLQLPRDADEVVGPFTSTRLFVCGDTLDRPLDDAVRDVHRHLWDGLDGASVSGVSVLRELRARKQLVGDLPLPVVFTSLIDVGPPAAFDRGWAMRTSFAVSQTTGVAIDHQMWEQDGELRIHLDLTDEAVDPGTGETLFAGLLNALRAFACEDMAGSDDRALNELQKAYYVSFASGPNTAWNGCQVYHSFEVDDLDPSRLATAWLRMVEAHDVLRTVVTHKGRLSVRRSSPERWDVPLVDLTGTTDPSGALARLRDDMVSRAFALGRWPRCDLRVTASGPGRGTVHVAVDLIVADGMSTHFLFRELMRLYADPDARPRPAGPPEEHSRRERALASPPGHGSWDDFWRDRFVGMPPGPALHAGPPAQHPAGRRRTRREGRVLDWTAIKQRIAARSVTPDGLLVTALTETLATHHPEPFTVPVVQWTAFAAPFRPGEFTALTWVSHDGARLPLLDRAEAHQRQIASSAGAPSLSGLAVLRKVVMKERRTGSYGFPVVYTGLLDLSGLPLPPGVSGGPWMTCTPDVSLDCVAVDEGGELRYYWDAVEADFPDGWLDRTFAGFERLLDALATSEGIEPVALHERSAGDGRGMPDSERQKVLYTWNETRTDFDADRLAHMFFEERARGRPDAVALRHRGGTVTYGQLNRHANRIARRLRSDGVRPNTVVGISISRSPAMVAAVLGVLKAGGAYLPIEPSLPSERVAAMVAQAGVTRVLAAGGSPLQVAGAAVLDVGDDDYTVEAGELDRDPLPTSGPDDTAYVIFTSGSTGQPKGVAVAHRSVLNLLNWCYRTFEFSEADTGLSVTSLGFDLSVFDILGLLGCGASLYLADETEQRDPDLLLHLLVDQPITFWNSAPTTLGQLSPLLSAVLGHPGCADLRLVFLSGDYTPLTLPDDLRRVFTNARIVSLGGATEATVWSNYFPIGDVDPQWRSIPYGRPIDNSRYYILGPDLDPCRIGEEGDLYIAGQCLAQGYWNQPALTAERFIPDPFSSAPCDRMYRTGDRASYMADGNICFLGRTDSQVKIRGFRVELGEIEHRLREHESVKDVVVLAQPGPGSDRTLVAYVVIDGPLRPSVKSLRSFAASTLPDYMVPNHVAFVDVFPATANGKLDRGALPWPLDGGWTPPPGPEETSGGRLVEQLTEELAQAFAETIGVARVDPSLDLWDQGATSFTMAQISGLLQDRHQRRVPVSVLLEHPTVEGIALALAGTVPDDAARPRIAAIAPPQSGPGSPAEVDFFSAEERDRFKAARWNERPVRAEEQLVPLADATLAPEHYQWRSTHREFLRTPIPYDAFSRFLGVLAKATVDGKAKHLYPSAGDTYAVQVYLQVRPHAVDGLPGGGYYYRPRDHALQRVGDRRPMDRSDHFQYNRPVFDEAGFGLYLVGQRRGIEPLYQEASERFLALEAGYMGQLLMMAQAGCGIGLCPVGSVAIGGVRDAFDLGEGHEFLQGFLGGPVEPGSTATADGERPLFSRHGAHQATPSLVDRVGAATGGIAIIGLAGRYPDAADVDGLWANLAAGRSSIGWLPEGRRRRIARPSPGGADDRAPAGGYLGDIERFDSLAFHISPQEARTLDPQLRLVLHAVRDCLADAGYEGASLLATAPRVGVFVGTMWLDYQHVGANGWERTGQARVSATGSDLANRVSHFFDFRGPSLAVDSSCSSSLAALHLAAGSLRRGECDAAVVAAVNLVAHPYHLAVLSGLDLITEGGAREAFDPGASGWSPGEGVGAVLLRPADAATRDQDDVWGTIEGTWVGHGGRGPRFGMPDVEAMATSIREALDRAGVEPGDVGYVECAAAGASVADAAEAEALDRVFGHRSSEGPALVGTIKPNIGHSEAASGLSQLTKVLLQMRHRTIAPTLVAAGAGTLVPWDGSALRLADRGGPWEPKVAGGPLRALVNAVGATGTYGHVLVRSEASGPTGVPPASSDDDIILLSATSAAELDDLASRMKDHLAALQGRTVAPSLRDIAYTLRGRAHLSHRLAISCSGISDLVRGIDAFLRGEARDGVSTGTGPSRSPAGVVSTSDRQEAVRLWLAGAEVNWSRCSAKGRRVPLPLGSSDDAGYWLDGLTDRPPPDGPAADEVDVAQATVRANEDYLSEVFSEVSGIALARVDVHVPLEHYGLNSYLVGQMNGRLERDLGRVPRTLFYEYQDLAGIAGYLAGRAGARDRARVIRPPTSADPATRHAGSPTPIDQDIAVIGLAGRYPLARNLEEFWENLVRGRDCVTMPPAARRRRGWPVEVMQGGFIDDVDCFDPLFFNITPRDAELMDPQERLFLEVAWESLEDAGYTRRRLRDQHRSNVGVFAGSMYAEYAFIGVEQSLTGAAMDTGAPLAGIANRVSYFLGTNGPSLAVDTMCSSSLTAIHLAVESLRRGECDLAIAGAVNLSLHPNKFLQQQRLHMTSSDHRCRSFGAGGDGFVPGEGVGAVVLKPLARAVADGDTVQAVIKATAVNHGGKTNGYMVPNPVAQGDVVRRALVRANVDPASISYVEAHGTGTALGDPIELNGLARAFEGATGAGPRAIGSVKSNVGHLEAAAGIAGLTKVVLQMRHGLLVPSLHAEVLNPEVDWRSCPFVVQRELQQWTVAPEHDGRPGRRRAGVSSFGAGGANAHVIVEDFEPEPSPPPAGRSGRPELFVLSARDEDRLVESARRLAAFLSQSRAEAERDVSTRMDPEAVSHTLQVGREAMQERIAVVASGLDELCRQLERYCAGEPTTAVRGSASGRSASGAGAAGGDPQPELAALGSHWANGGEVDWSQLRSGRPLRIVRLPTYPFAKVRCWPRDDPPGSAAFAAEGSNGGTIPLYTRSWHGAAGATVAPTLGGRYVCLFNRTTERVARVLAGLSGRAEVILVPEDSSVGAGALAPRALDAVASGPPPSAWIDLCDFGCDEDAGDWRARLALLRARIPRSRDAGDRWLHVTRGLLEMPGPAPALAGARMAAFVRLLSSASEGISGTVMDTDLSPDEPAAAAQIWAELAERVAPAEVCYREGARYRLRFAEVSGQAGPDWRADPAKSYVVTGGTRGLGALVARHLLRLGARNLALLGARPIPARERWDDADLPGDARSTVEHVRQLEGEGGRVLLHGAPLVRRRELAGFLARVRAELGEIGGVVHCAGRWPTGLPSLADKENSDITAVLEPKVDGLSVLADLCAGDTPSFFVLFSSVAAAVPALARGVVDYSAANGFMDLFAAHQARGGRPWFRSVNWPVWEDAGSGAAGAEACRRLGIGSLSDEEGLRLLERVMATDVGPTVLPCPLPRRFDPNTSLERPLPHRTAVTSDPPHSRRPAGGPSMLAADDVPAWLIQLFSESLGIPGPQLDPVTEFGEWGVESVMLAELVRRVERQIGRPLEPSILIDHPTLGELAAHLRELDVRSSDAQEPTTTDIVEARTASLGGSGELEAGAGTKVAVIGMACRFPGAPSVDAFWDNLVGGRCAITEVPPSRWDARRLYSPTHPEGRTISKWGGFVDPIEDFDPGHFGMSEAEAVVLDPAIRLFLEGAVACLRDAGYEDEELRGRDVAVMVGARMSNYGQRTALHGLAAGLGAAQNFIAARAAHQFDFRGPNLVVDSACSSALVSIRLACQSLLSGESELALAGGVDVLLDEEPYLQFTAARALSPTGRCRAFDARADGFVPAEGCGVLALKPLAAAMRDGDRVHAVIDAVAVNNDGQTMGLTTPNHVAQAAVVRRALAASGLDIDDVRMVEAHGTGTMIGDPIELTALCTVFRELTDRVGFCAIGSVKSNIGHLLSAAGVAGLIKAVLAVEHGRIPPTLFCQTPNPRFDFSHSPYFPNTELRDWPADVSVRAAGVSAFGLGGTNAHAVVSSMDSQRRAGRPVRRYPLPPPVFRRRRFWLNRDPAAEPMAAAPRTVELLIGSLLDLQFSAVGATDDSDGQR